jgi:hypothetical protein
MSMAAFDTAQVIALYKYSIRFIIAFIGFSIFHGQKQVGFVPKYCLSWAVNQFLVL